MHTRDIEKQSEKAGLEIYQQQSFKTLHEAYFYQFASEMMIKRWQRIHYLTSFLTSITATGSAIAGWTLWNSEHGKIIWAIMAGSASLLAILHNVLGVQNQINDEEKIRQIFLDLRVDVETFRQKLTLGRITLKEADRQNNNLRERLNHCMQQTRLNMIFTMKAHKQIEEKVESILRDK